MRRRDLSIGAGVLFLLVTYAAGLAAIYFMVKH